MALINCPECNKEISDTVKKCPNCGYTVNKVNKKPYIIGGIAVIIIIVAIIGIVAAVPKIKYNNAVKLLESEDYQNALTLFKALGNYSDSIEKTEYINNKLDYLNAKKLADNGDLEKAKDILISLKGFEDSDTIILDINNEISYKEAKLLINSQKYEEAKEILVSLSDFKDSQKLLDDINNELAYQGAMELLYNAEYDKAIQKFETIPTYKDSEEIINTAKNEQIIYSNLVKLKTELYDPNSFELRDVLFYSPVDGKGCDIIIEYSGNNKMGGKAISYALLSLVNKDDSEPILMGTAREEYVQSMDEFYNNQSKYTVDDVYELAIGTLIYCDLYSITEMDGITHELKQLTDFPIDINRLNNIIKAN